MSAPAHNTPAFSLNKMDWSFHNALKWALWEDMEEAGRRALTATENELTGDWNQVPVKKFFTAVANTAQNLLNMRWAQQVIFEFPCIVEFFPNRHIPSTGTIPAPAAPLAPCSSAPRVMFALLSPTAPPCTLPQPSTVANPTFCLT
ncbi:hypothetical protein PHLCEN_2v6083 [Hermanssonia centrifuga]|uniref:Uncharacterized protein n=1 Tax=Hermanssonia centrifuga TaxID=98765 RepID=A0A2R6P0F6_9APHY|nr:hypothetical protein PHLCEN_2v6083 [Hermanssonia centrifuga]